MTKEFDPDNFYIRRLQRRQNGSLFISIPAKLIQKMDWKGGMTIRFYVHQEMIILVAVKSNITKKDLKSVEKFLEGQGDPSDLSGDAAVGVLEKGRQRTETTKYDNPLDDPDFNPLERLRIK